MKEIVLAGFGGQGVLTAGLIISQMASFKGYNATWSPQYGSAMRGGTAMCTVKFGKEYIYHPTADTPNILLAMNRGGYDAYSNTVKPGGTIVINSDEINVEEINLRTDVNNVVVPCKQIAKENDVARSENIVMVGVVIRETEDFTYEEALNGMNDMFRKKGKEAFEESNTIALKAGWDYKK
ncbi:MAG: keto:oxoacid ferredoxin oxidoreductase [Tissierellia bacterium]|nr:keto:oxoacid ferredoxin oxidoreductase [Tissierellia bacterium]